MHPLVLSKAIELSLVTLWQVKTCSITVCSSLPSHSWFLSYRVSLFFFFVSDLVGYIGLGMAREWKKIEFPKEYCIWIWEQQDMRGRTRNRWQDEVREDGRIVGWEGWQEKVHNRGEWKKLLTTARNCHICTCQWNEWIYILCCLNLIILILLNQTFQSIDSNVEELSWESNSPIIAVYILVFHCINKMCITFRCFQYENLKNF
jgi:hypothetical protein